VTESGRAVPSAAGVRSATQDGDAVVVEVGSGDYVFIYPAKVLPVRSGPN
jgi:hypothetical protein